MAPWLDVAFGKFKCWQRTLPEGDRLTREQLHHAWRVWDLMRKCESAAASGDDTWADELHAMVLRMTAVLKPEQAQGPRVFSRWLVENRPSLERALKLRAVAEKAHTSDTVSAELTR